MEATVAHFVVNDVVWKYAQSDNIGDDRSSVVGLSRADVTCNDCGVRWNAVESRNHVKGTFQSYLGAVKLHCISCDTTEMLSLRLLSKPFPWRQF